MIYHILLLKNSFISKKHPKKNFACGATWDSAPHPARGCRPLGNLPHPDFPLATPLPYVGLAKMEQKLLLLR